VVYGAYGLSYTTPKRIAELQLVALYTMVMPALVALLQTFYSRE
jgi:hypothetical protein